MSMFANLAPRTLRATGLASIRGGRQIFRDISFSLTAGEGLFLRGRNGAGKTTLLNILTGALHHSTGSFSISGRTEDDRPGADMHFVGHLPAIKPSLSVVENLAFWTRINEGDAALITPSLKAAGLATLAELDAAILSAGQIKRLALCRLLVAPRPIWLLDEPTSALDAEGDTWVGTLIDAHLAAGGLLVAATHRDIGLAGQTNVTTLTIGGTMQ